MKIKLFCKFLYRMFYVKNLDQFKNLCYFYFNSSVYGSDRNPRFWPGYRIWWNIGTSMGWNTNEKRLELLK